MPKFRKKPVVIEARQFTTNNEAGDKNMEELVSWMTEAVGLIWAYLRNQGFFEDSSKQG